MINALRPFLSRIIGWAVAGLCGWLAVRFGVSIDTDTQTELVVALVGVVIPLMGGVASVVHRLVDKRLNPGDAASSHLAVVERAETAELKTDLKASK
jgi:hypothetical protein